ncbi:MAG: hypothetical protein LBC71_05015 [Oscillospiraceae bacterium]|jgi:hypothetical protein|nr:hypothetical protein [Oscillospiraceae bacterium]
MQFCDKCRLTVKDNSGNTIADLLAKAGELCQKGRAGGEQAYSVVKNALSTLESKGGCSSCINSMRGFKSQLESML